ncbi:MAG: hypothetical protein HDT44_07930 [Ruminococcaceae bacterium]|nr:hypothetical protein [Oscillospiraceae bacterium]
MKKYDGYVMTAKIGYIAASVMTAVLGAVFIFAPETSIAVICRLLGAAAVICGIIKLFGYFSRDMYRLAFQHDLAFGIMLCAIGIIAVVKPVKIISAAHFAVGIIIIADGVFKLQTAIDSKRFGLGKWWLIAVCALLCFVHGIILVSDPFEAAAAMTVLMGIAMIVDGIMNFCVAFCAVKSRSGKDHVDAEFTTEKK